MGLAQGLEGLWTPRADCDWAGCDPNCNVCGQVCATGAIRALPMKEKRAARMGLAEVNPRTCLPHAGTEECQLCYDQCKLAGYDAIQRKWDRPEKGKHGVPDADTGFLVPEVLTEKCVGCGLCQARCHAINVRERHVLDASAIVVAAGAGKEDRVRRGSYVAPRAEAPTKAAPEQPTTATTKATDVEYNPLLPK
jgi:NAD-dependent dihydropyrimidine dehydrogenase PreA subunit